MRVRLLTLLFVVSSAGCADSSPAPLPAAETPAASVTLDSASAGPAPAPADLPEPSEALPVIEPLPPEPPAGEDRTLPPAPPPVPETPAPPPAPLPDRTRAAESFWSSFQAAIRSGDRAPIEAGLAEVVTVGEVEYTRSSTQVQSVLDQIVENEQVRAAYLDAGGLVHGPDQSTFSSTVRVETPEGDVTEARLSGAIREVAPGDWRLVRLRTDPVR